MSNIALATQIITDLYGDAVGVEALADEHLLVTDEIQAVLDAAVARREVILAFVPDERDTNAYFDWVDRQSAATIEYNTAVENYLRSRQS